jgi:REP element-mobilizing transposase RayT
MNRGARRHPVFLSDDHCVLFLDCVGSASDRFALEVHAYVLMPNHYHLLVRSIRGNLSAAIQHLAGRFTREMNRQQGWDGPIFRGRFRSQFIEEESHLRQVVPYLHLNPVRAGLVVLPQQARSCTTVCGEGESVMCEGQTPSPRGLPGDDPGLPPGEAR